MAEIDPQEAGAIALHSLPVQSLLNIFRDLSPRDLTAVACTCKALAAFLTSAEADVLWHRQCEQTFYVSEAVGPSREQLPSFRAACLEWHAICKKYGTHGLRAVRAMARIRSWLQVHAPEIASTLRPGATEETFKSCQRKYKRKIPVAIRALYSVHDGQDLLDPLPEGQGEKSPQDYITRGLFGGYSLYNHYTCTMMAPLSTDFGPSRVDKTSFLIGASLLCNRYLVYNQADLEVYAPGKITTSLVSGWKLSRDVPDWMSAEVERTGYQPPGTANRWSNGYDDALFVWLEAYADALTSGTFALARIIPEEPWSRGIVLFPNKPPLMKEAITQGIRVRVSTVFIPEESLHRAMSAYSVRFKLLSEEEQRAAGESQPLSSVQLLSRHWRILNGYGERVDEVEGDGVIGKHPLLLAGGEEFVYQSASSTSTDENGFMEGEFTFVEGSLESRGSRVIQACCPRFELTFTSIMW
jgi:F-box protein 3